jgi:tetratricopeptide (TPR) repeat protein
MSRRVKFFLISLAGIFLLGILLFQIPSIRSRVIWRYEVWTTRLKNTLDPVVIPTPIPSTPFATFTPLPPPPTLVATQPATPTLIPLPHQVHLTSPAYEKQDINNCGPAILSMTLRMYGWEGTQFDIANIVKPIKQDRNVNPEELRYFILNEAGWLKAEYRVAGTLDLLKRLLAAGYPVIVEVAGKIDQQDANGPNDDLWDAHYLLVNGYDEAEKIFIVQDSQHGPEKDADKKIPYEMLEKDWKPFNYLYMVVFPQDDAEIQSIIGMDWDADLNRQNAMDLSNAQIAENPEDAFAWFNLGASLTYFERYQEAAQAFDQAFKLRLPQRMTRYQFWPFSAYFNADRIDYLLEITEKTYKLINGYYAEEALLWHGYGLLRKGDINGALADWNKALKVHPNYCDAERAINDYIQPTYDLTNCSP